MGKILDALQRTVVFWLNFRQDVERSLEKSEKLRCVTTLE